MPLATRSRIIVVGLGLMLSTSLAASEIVAIVSVKNPIESLDKNQLTEIFLGKISRFPDGSQAVPIDQGEGAAARDEFYLKYTGKSAAQIKAHWSKIIFTGRGQPPVEVASSQEVKRRVAADPHVIGYLERSMVDASVKVVVSE